MDKKCKSFFQPCQPRLSLSLTSLGLHSFLYSCDKKPIGLQMGKLTLKVVGLNQIIHVDKADLVLFYSFHAAGWQHSVMQFKAPPSASTL